MNKDSSRKTMRNGRFLLGVVAFCCTSLLACTSGIETLDPDKLPYKLEEVFQDDKFFPIDLDGDGYDERISYNIYPTTSNVGLKTHDGQTIDQANYALSIQPPQHFLDLDGDNHLEVLVPFVRNDSLFVSIVDSQGKKQDQIYLTKGKPRLEEDGLIPWKASICAAFTGDVNADGRDELITVIATQIARLPRGVFIHSLPDGESMGQYVIGSMPQPGSIFLGNFDDDEHLEVLAATGASNNGAVAGGLDDEHSYLVSIDLGPPPEREWYDEKGGLWIDARLIAGDFDGDGKDEYLAFTETSRGRPTPAVLQLIDPATGRVYLQQKLTMPLLDVAVVNLDHDTRDEILVLGVSGELTVLNDELEVVRHRWVMDSPKEMSKDWIRILPDVDDDDIDEIVVRTSSQLLFLDPHLRVKAVSPVASVNSVGIFRRGVARPPYVYISRGDQTHVFELVLNRFYLFKHYGPWALWIFAVSLVLVTCIVVVSYYQRGRQLGKAVRLHAERSLDQERKTRGLANSLESHVTSIRHALRSMERVYRKSAPGIADQIDEHSADILSEIENILQHVRRFGKGRSVQTNGSLEQSTDLAFLEEATAIVEENLGDPAFSVARLASEMHYSERQLQRRIKNASGCRPSDFIMQIRLAHAAKLLEENDYSIKRVALEVGFRTPNHFSTKFREAYGVAPSEYKAKAT